MRILSPISLLITAASYRVGTPPRGQSGPTLDQLVDYAAGWVEIQVVAVLALVVLARDVLGREPEMRDIIIGTVCGLFLCEAAAFPPCKVWLDVLPDPRGFELVAALGGVSLGARMWRLRRLLAAREHERRSPGSASR